MKTIFLTLIIIISYGVSAQNDELLAKHFNLNDKNVAISGYDPISYFDSKPSKGKSSISSEYKGIVYYFKDEDNKNKFEQYPSKFIPKYGGWCAYALAEKGELMGVNPKTYKITDGKLYLFYNKFFTNTLEYWIEDESDLKLKGDKNWNKVLNSPEE